MHSAPAVVIEIGMLCLACLWLGVRRGWFRLLRAEAVLLLREVVAFDRRIVVAAAHAIASLLLGTAAALGLSRFSGGIGPWWTNWILVASFFIGITQAGLIGTWTALGTSSWKLRAAGLLLGAVYLAEASRPDRALRLAFFCPGELGAFGMIALIECSLLILLLAICRWRGRRLVWFSPGSLQASKPQISLGEALTGMVLIAVCLSIVLTLQTVPRSFQIKFELVWWLLSWVLVPLVGVWATLAAKNPLLRLPVPFLVGGGFSCLRSYCEIGSWPWRHVAWSEILRTVLIPGLVPVLLVVVTLLLVRRWGYRLVETKACAPATGKAAGGFQNTTPFVAEGAGSEEVELELP